MTAAETTSSWRWLARAARDFGRIVWRAMSDRKADAIAVVVFGVAGAMAQVGAIGALLGFLRLMSEADSGETVSWNGVEMPSGLGGLMLASSALGAMLAIAAGANYLSVRRARAIGRSCMEHSVIALMELIQHADSLPEGMDERTVRDIGVRGSRLTGISVENTIQLIGPTIQLVILLGAMFWLDALVAALLLPALLIPLPALWRFNRSVRASANLFYGSAASGFGKSVGRAITTLLSTRGHNQTIGHATVESYRQTPDVHLFYNTYDDMHLTASRAVLITSLFRPLILVYVLFLLGLQTTRGDLTWPVAIAYLLVLIQATTRAEGLIAQFSVLSRLYTQVEPFIRLSEHVKASSGAQSEAADTDGAIEFTHGPTAVRASPGRPVQVFTGAPLGRLQLARVIESLAPSITAGLGRVRAAAFVARRYQPSGATGARLVTGLDEPDEDAINRVLLFADALGVRGEIEQRLDTTLEASAWSEMTLEARTVFQLGPVLCSASSAVLVDIGILSPLERTRRERALELLADRVLLILAPDYASGCSHADGVVALDGDRVVWAGERAEWHASDARAALVPDRSARAAASTEEEFEDGLE